MLIINWLLFIDNLLYHRDLLDELLLRNYISLISSCSCWILNLRVVMMSPKMLKISPVHDVFLT